MKNTPDRNKLIASWLHDPSEGVRMEAVRITVDTGELLRLVHQDESTDVRRAALEQLARLSDRLSADEREKLLHMVLTDFDALFPLGNRRIYGLRVCPDCGSTGLRKDFNESDPCDDTGEDREKAADGGSTAVWTCRRCGRKENHDFSVDRRDWLQGSFFYGSGRSDLVERIIERRRRLLGKNSSKRLCMIKTGVHAELP